GRFGNSAQTLTLTNLVPGTAYTLGFDLYIIDSWDGGSDLFNVRLNRANVFQQSFGQFGSQGYTGQPDEGRANFGFAPNWVDAIYRNIEINFVASNAATAISFYGLNLENIDNESWGLDNIGVRPSTELTNTFIRSSSLPVAGSTNSI